MLKTKLITKETDFIALGKEWNSLLRRSEANNIFLTWEWISTWWDVFGGEKELFVAVFSVGGAAVGIAPFYIKSARYYGVIPLKVLMFLGTGEEVRSEYLDLIVKPEYREEVLSSLISLLKNSSCWDMALLKDIPSSSPLSSHLLNNLKNSDQFLATSRQSDDCYYIKLPPDYDSYLSGLDSTMRRNIKNRRRNLEKNFTTEYRVLKDPDKLDEWMMEFSRLHQKRMREKALPGKFTFREYREFHRRIAALFMQEGQLLPFSVSCNGKTTAARYSFVYRGKIYDYQTGFDPDFSRQGVMQALIGHIIEWAVENNFQEFDFLAGGEDYKRRFSNAVSRIYTFTVFNNTVRGKTARASNRIRRLQKSLFRKRNWGKVILNPFFSREEYLFYQKNIGTDEKNIRIRPEVEIRKIDPEDRTLLAGIARLKGESNTEKFEKRLRVGKICYCASIGAYPVSFIWIDRKGWHLEDNDPPKKLPTDSAFIFDCRTHHGWRGMRIYPLLLKQAAAELNKDGITFFLILVNKNNPAGIKAVEKAGFYQYLKMSPLMKKTVLSR